MTDEQCWLSSIAGYFHEGWQDELEQSHRRDEQYEQEELIRRFGSVNKCVGCTGNRSCPDYSSSCLYRR